MVAITERRSNLFRVPLWRDPLFLSADRQAFCPLAFGLRPIFSAGYKIKRVVGGVRFKLSKIPLISYPSSYLAKIEISLLSKSLKLFLSVDSGMFNDLTVGILL